MTTGAIPTRTTSHRSLRNREPIAAPRSPPALAPTVPQRTPFSSPLTARIDEPAHDPAGHEPHAGPVPPVTHLQGGDGGPRHAHRRGGARRLDPQRVAVGDLHAALDGRGGDLRRGDADDGALFERRGLDEQQSEEWREHRFPRLMWSGEDGG